MPSILSRLSIFKYYISRNLDNTKLLLYKLFVLYLVVKPVCVNPAYSTLKLLEPRAPGQNWSFIMDLHSNVAPERTLAEHPASKKLCLSRISPHLHPLGMGPPRPQTPASLFLASISMQHLWPIQLQHCGGN